MKLVLGDIVNKHKDIPCVVALHGPSLTPFIHRVEELQKNKGFLRISVNEWYDFFSTKPDYWVVSNTEFTIKNSMVPNHTWDEYFQWPKNIFNEMGIPLIFNETADLTETEFIENYLKCDYLPYDAKHFKNKDCRSILNSFRSYYEKNSNFNFLEYGNNDEMWKPLTLNGARCHPSYAKFASAWARDNKCCHKIDHTRRTIQEQLQAHTGNDSHMGPGVSVAFHALATAVLMGCNPIYVAGLDLEMEKGYAQTRTNRKQVINQGAMEHWTKVFNNVIESDLRILRESAEKLGIDIINLNKESWFDTLKIGNLN